MNEGTKNFVKRRIAWLLIVLMSINSFAAVVGDNDGAAFITKAEFESLKNDFQSQINRYNTSLDNKIDGAIASYLSGIKVKKESELKVLVSNYNTMRWVAGWHLYGKQKTWTAYSTKTESTLGWFKPPCDRRVMMRGTDFRIYDCFSNAFGGYNTYLYMSLDSSKDGALLQRNAYTATDGYDQTPPLFAVYQTWNTTDQKFYVNYGDPYKNLFCYDSAAYCDYHTYSGYAAWQNVNAMWMPTAVSLLSTSGNQILKYTYTGAFWGSADNTSDFTSTITTANCGYPQQYGGTSAYNTCGMNDSNNASTQSSDKIGNPFLYGVHWVYEDYDTRTRQQDLLHYMMLGKNNNQTANLYQFVYGRNNGGSKIDVSDTEFGTVNFTLKQFGSGNPGAWDSRNRTTPTLLQGLSLTGSLKVPKLKYASISDLSTNTYRYNNKALTYGQGLPLVSATSVLVDCDIQAEFDYRINYLLNSTNYTSSLYLLIDLKRGDFSDQATTALSYFEAYDDIVDTDTTSASMHRYQQYRYPTRTGHVKMTIPMKKEEELWMRLCPSNDSGGYYVTISNLKLKQITN